MKRHKYVFKFGGASIRDVAGIRNVANILEKYAGDELAVVISASGKTTNHLEEVMEAYFKGTGELDSKLAVVKNHHKTLMDGLFQSGDPIYEETDAIYREIDWIYEARKSDDYDFLYDQLVSLGELLSTRIVAAYLNRKGIPTHWADARKIIITDDTYRESQINWEDTIAEVRSSVQPLLSQGKIVLTQGFIGSTED
ncbi:MAG TPA: aspartate kinase, partial [Saprospiraceae bacterium]|nr:aspartate kinase [Saprospiraceae bacterium]